MNEQDEAAVKAVVAEGKDDVELFKKLSAEAKDKGWKEALTAHAPEILAELKEDYAAVTAVAPLVKSGYKTTEFWLVAGIIALNAWKPLPWDTNAIIGAVIGIYTFVRGQAKKA